MTSAIGDTVRIDLWLWAARFFKTRSLASKAVRGGHVHVDGSRVKPARGLKVGDRLSVSRGRVIQDIVVLALSDRRGPASVAVTLYKETPDSVARREAAAEAARLARGSGPAAPAGRPDKRSRRAIHRMRRESGE